MREVEVRVLPSVFVLRGLQGSALQRRHLRVTYKDKNIAEILDTPIEEAAVRFQHHKQLPWIMNTRVDVGLGYLARGQPATTLSGGEAQRVELARELARVQIDPSAETQGASTGP